MLSLMAIPSATVVPELECAQLAGFSDPELDYAQVLAEAHSYLATQPAVCRTPLPTRSKNACHSTQGEAKESSSSSQSWKSSLFFWRKRRKQKPLPTCDSPQHSLFRSGSKSAAALHPSECHRKKVKSGPIYSGETPCLNSHRSSRFLSGPISGSTTSSTIPYRQLEHHSRRPVTSKAPIYMAS